MNSKMIAIIAVVAMCGAALVGVGYAYTATITNSDNSVTSVSEYAVVSLGESTDGTVTINNAHLTYNYNANATDSKYYTFEKNSYAFTDTSKVTIVTKNPTDVKKIQLTITTPTIDENCDGIERITLVATTIGGVTGYSITGSNGVFTISKDGNAAFADNESLTLEVTFTLTVTTTSTAMSSTYEIDKENLSITYLATVPAPTV